MFECILFDLDGTLTPTLAGWLKAFHMAFAEFGLLHSDVTILNTCFRDHKQVETKFGLNSDVFEKRLHAALRESVACPELFAGVVEVLDHCRQGGTKLGVVSSAPRDYVLRVLEALNIRERFQAIVSSSDVPQLKPHPAPVLAAIKLLGAHPEATLLVGDARTDILAGRAAAVSTGLFFPEENAWFHTFSDLINARPDFVFADYLHLQEVISRPQQLEHSFNDAVLPSREHAGTPT